MSRETTKALRRRWVEDQLGFFPWRKVFTGKMIDIGAGPDPLPFAEVTPFDKEHGDANRILEYFPEQSFSVVNGSHVLEHLLDARQSMRDFLKLLKPGGYVVQLVPDLGAYERFTYPSRHNGDHKSSWSMLYKASAFPVHYHIPSFLREFEDEAEILHARYVEERYDWKLPPTIDQTLPEDGAEIWNEWVLRKR